MQHTYDPRKHHTAQHVHLLVPSSLLCTPGARATLSSLSKLSQTAQRVAMVFVFPTFHGLMLWQHHQKIRSIPPPPARPLPHSAPPRAPDVALNWCGLSVTFVSLPLRELRVAVVFGQNRDPNDGTAVVFCSVLCPYPPVISKHHQHIQRGGRNGAWELGRDGKLEAFTVDSAQQRRHEQSHTPVSPSRSQHSSRTWDRGGEG